MKEAIAYYRVSTDKQGKSGLGLDAQRLLVEGFARREGYELRDAFVEIESGRKNDRPILEKALRLCKRHKATLLIAHLDRLARNVKFIAGLIEAKVPFRIVSHPNANKAMLQMLSVFAEQQSDDISEKTKAGLQAAKLKGVELGNNGRMLARLNRIKARCFARQMAPKIEEIRSRGITTWQGLADELNRLKIATYRNDGSKWHKTTAQRLVKRIASL